MGLLLKDLPAAEAKPLGYAHAIVRVEGLASGANAQKAGVKAGDVILTYNGLTIGQSRQLVAAAKASKPGTTAKLIVRRDGRTIAFKVLIVSRATFIGTGIEALKGKRLPQLSGQSVFTGKTVELTKLAGRPLIVELWATWCPACVANIPKLDALARANADRLSVVSVSFEDVKTVKAFFADHAPSYDSIVVTLESMSMSYLSNASIPKFIVVDKSGTVVAVTTSAEETEAALQPLLH